jgi:hypothetical protein
MNRIPLIKALTIMSAVLVSVWLMTKPAALPSLPTEEKEGSPSQDFRYNTVGSAAITDEILSRPLFLSSRRPFTPPSNDNLRNNSTDQKRCDTPDRRVSITTKRLNAY